MKATKILIGSSVRAAAMSAIRKGEVPYCIDLFADRDLVRIAETVRCPIADYPHGLPRLLAAAPDLPWDYTGGLENHPDSIAEMRTVRPLVGNPPEVLKLVRDPFWLAEMARTFGFRFPATALDPDDLGGATIRKPFRGSGGRGISLSRERHPDYYFQQLMDPAGMLHSAVYRDGTFAGESEQFVGQQPGEPEYGWCGGTTEPVRRIAPACEVRPFLDFLVERSGLRGDFGFDLLRRTDSECYLLEVNPRYTSSMEIVEFTTASQYCRKQILFAERRMVFPADGPWMRTLDEPFDPNRLPEFADIPHPGEVIEAGWPILTMLWVADRTPGETRR